jgi:hypothetical protein
VAGEEDLAGQDGAAGLFAGGTKGALDEGLV